MALPPKPALGNHPNATVVASTSTDATAGDAAKGGKSVLKKFGPARVSEDEGAALVSTPTAAGLDLIALSTSLFNTLKSTADAAGIALDQIMAFAADADKSKFPGHKNGRIAYATIGTINSLGKINGLINKQRGPGGSAALKAKVVEKDSKIAELEAQLAALMAQIKGGAK